MKLYKSRSGIILEHSGVAVSVKEDWDALINRSNLQVSLQQLHASGKPLTPKDIEVIVDEQLLAPIGHQELWAAGVTYLRSRDARMEESKKGGAADFYQKVYEAERPELFFKALPHRIAAHREEVYIRKDSTWNVPEPELTLCINAQGNVIGYTIGNDMSSRSIEGENPLYLPQAKTYERSAALGPCLWIPEKPPAPDTNITLTIKRNDQEKFSGSITLSRMKRSLTELVSWLYRECRFPTGCYLMTGTGIVPPDDFTLSVGDEISIAIDGIGRLENRVAVQQ
jgi:2-dehydro-3-deoxy-D-arabinonate dehydratase